MHFTFLIILLLTVLYPIIRSFENKIEYYYKWKYAFTAIIFSLVIFIPWTIYFSTEEIWKYNSNFITNIYIKGLPLEEWLFFIIIPFASLYIYEVIHYYVKKSMPYNLTILITILLAFLLVSFAAMFYNQVYTSSTFFGLAGLLIFHLIVKSKYLFKFYIAYLLALIPFFLINGFITYLEIVTANDYYNVGVRIFTIPIEDFLFFMLNFLVAVTIFEWVRPSRK
jgi:lycopene cyclase domain-containing protein